MYTVEFEFDSVVITSLDEQDRHEDVEVLIADDGAVFVRQFDDSLNRYHLISISLQQLLDLYAAMESTEGAFKLELTRGKQ
jgi:hypothetical protein